jgi:hypothetical protein
MLRISNALILGMALGLLLGVQTALAGKTLIAKEYVGPVENKDRIGGGEGEYFQKKDVVAISGVSSRFAESDNTIAEDSPAGDSNPTGNPNGACDPSLAGQSGDPLYGTDANVTVPAGCLRDFVPTPGLWGPEQFTADGAFSPTSPVESVNGFPVFQSLPTCSESGQVGQQAVYAWTIGIERPVVSDLQIQICLDVRKCQEEDDDLGQASTPPVPDLVIDNRYIAPALVRVSAIAGQFQDPNAAGVQFARNDIRIPGLATIPWLGPQVPNPIPNPIEGWIGTPPIGPLVLEESIEFIGKDCLSKWISNEDRILRAQDLIKVEVVIPGSINVRVRASQDAAALCYIGTPLFGEEI